MLFWLLPLPLPTAVLCVISVRNTALSHALALWRWNVPVIRWCHTSWPAPPLPPRMGTGYWGVSRSIRSGFLTPACWSYAAFSWGNTKQALYERAGLAHDTNPITKTPLQRILPLNWKEKSSGSLSFTLFIETGIAQTEYRLGYGTDGSGFKTWYWQQTQLFYKLPRPSLGPK
jgi:hypothetical protein